MRRNCNLELSLVPPSAAIHSADYDDSRRHQLQPMLDSFNGSPKDRQLQQQLTIFYNGRVSFCDATELQARSIIMLASREMEEKLKSPLGLCSEPSSPLLQSPLCSPNSGLSMKKSLQRFLQKRKNRIQATSPYNH